MRLNERAIDILGWTASAAAILMFLSFIDQIALNLVGEKGSKILPLATMINCALWTGYALLKARRDWPVAVANFPGVVLGAVAFVTAF